MQTLAMILASTIRGEIGSRNVIPWRLKGDLPRFKLLTHDNVVIMGRKTFESMGSVPLPERINFVVSKTMEPQPWVFPTIESAIKAAMERYPEKTIYLIGGTAIYEYGLAHADRIELTLVLDRPDRSNIVYDAVIPNFNIDKGDWIVVKSRTAEDSPVGNSAITLPSHRYITLDRKIKEQR